MQPPQAPQAALKPHAGFTAQITPSRSVSQLVSATLGLLKGPRVSDTDDSRESPLRSAPSHKFITTGCHYACHSKFKISVGGALRVLPARSSEAKINYDDRFDRESKGWLRCTVDSGLQTSRSWFDPREEHSLQARLGTSNFELRFSR